MGFRDRFFTPKTARAILSWRLAAAIGIGIAIGVANIGAGIGVGVAMYAALVGSAMPKEIERPRIDPFVLSEPWRQIMQRAQGAERKMRATVDDTSDGPLKETLADIADQLGRGLAEAWEVAKRGDEIDDAIRRLDPTTLRSRAGTLEQRAAAEPSTDAESALASVRRQLATAERLRQQSDETAATLRLTQTQLDELIARASEVRIGAVDTERYRRDVDDLVIRLEALHQAVEETRTA